MKINHNLSAVITNTELRRNENTVASAMERLSTGIAINHSKDNPVGMAISNMMKTQIRGLDRATENAQTFVSLLNTAEGAVAEMHSVAQRMRELAVQAANDTNTELDRESLQNEMESLQKEIDRISKDTEFNGKGLIDGTMDRPTYLNGLKKGDADGEGDWHIEVIKPAEPAKLISPNAATLDPADDTLDPDTTVNGSVTLEIGSGDQARSYGTAVLTTVASVSWDMNKDCKYVFSDRGMEVYSQQNLYDALKYNLSQYGVDFDIKEGKAVFEIQSDEKLYSKTNKTEHIPYASSTQYIQIFAEGNLADLLGLSSTSSNIAWGKDAVVKAVPTKNGFSDTTLDNSTNGSNFKIIDSSGVTVTGVLDDDAAAGTQASVMVPKIHLPIGQIGAGEDQILDVKIPKIDTETLNLEKLSLDTFESAGDALGRIDEAIQQISDVRAHIGAMANRFEYTISYLEDNSENMNDAVSTIADTDMAEEMTEYTSQNVLTQAATSMLAQANDAPEQLLQLLQ